MSNPLLSKLEISVRKASASPPKLAISVTNTHDQSLTVLKWDSPLDPLVIQLGHLKITPVGADGPLDIPIIQVRRIMPAGKDQLVTIEPGETKEHEIELKETIVPLDKLAGGARIVCEGEWTSVWQSKLEEVDKEALENLGMGNALRGSYESKPVTVEF
ncbi:uncharacterized protein BCR38DRAFT_412268 [Pseudomassariella vexata]|uniref:Uncharacterized protein n=1 Tax=Pseudomassariella vexata TaxID=1141098 RepID=A0A1Y2DLC5_9PEZI|nr:uncharacterized protein BCR38DRAFT_412268 [Pseudomassariella vexata]ORY60063.1 hypothetical protein BCR38DRAFT_412268 [Pseudomassariella vexata]